MTREIKFRVWNGKEMITPMTANNNAEIFAGLNSTGLEYSEYMGKGVYRRFPLMQYTGIKDKNGKEICESDIVKRCVYGKVYIKEVLWIAEEAKFATAFDMSGMGTLENPSNTEVIGNIYENPELINEK